MFNSNNNTKTIKSGLTVPQGVAAFAAVKTKS